MFALLTFQSVLEKDQLVKELFMGHTESSRGFITNKRPLITSSEQNKK